MAHDAYDPARPLGVPHDASADNHEVTRLLHDIADGKSSAKNDLVDLIYNSIYRVAEAHCRADGGNQTLDAGSLVSEAYIRVLGKDKVEFTNRRHLFGAFANAMREVLVDAARRRQAAKRNSGKRPVGLVDAPARVPALDVDVLDLESVLPAFEATDPRAAEVARLKVYAALADDVIADVMGLSTRSVQREWLYARATLRERIEKGVKL